MPGVQHGVMGVWQSVRGHHHQRDQQNSKRWQFRVLSETYIDGSDYGHGKSHAANYYTGAFSFTLSAYVWTVPRHISGVIGGCMDPVVVVSVTS